MDLRVLFKKWRITLFALAVVIPLGIIYPEAGDKTMALLGVNVATLLSILPPVLLLIGLFDAWIPRERVAPHLGEGSGLKGVVLALLLGAGSAGPLYVAFPVAEVLMRKGASVRNVFIFVGSWSTLRLPMILFELENMGYAFGLSRYAASFFGVLLMAALTDRALKGEEKKALLGRYMMEE